MIMNTNPGIICKVAEYKALLAVVPMVLLTDSALAIIAFIAPEMYFNNLY